jgi:GxxExxY protein
MDTEKIFKTILDCAFKVHSELGPGLLESAYEECLFYELKQVGLKVEKQKPMPLIYQEIKMDVGYRMDLFVEDCIVVEVKAVETMHPLFLSQTLTYLKLSHCKLGLLINFNVPHLRDGIKRVIL